MSNHGCTEILLEYINQQDIRTPIFSAQASDYVAEKLGKNHDSVRKTVAVVLGRLASQGSLKRLSKGVYGKQVVTPFGISGLSDKDAALIMLMRDDRGDIIGYETGDSLMNQLGLCSQMPNKTYVASNNYRKKLAANLNIEVRCPKMHVTQENVKYLQVLDAIYYLNKVPVDVNNPHKVIRRLIDNNNLDIKQLYAIARRAYSKEVALSVMDIVTENV